MLREKKPIRSYHGEQFRTNPTNKKHLAEDFGHRCAYCDDLDTYGGGYRAYHVEHFAPKEKFPALRFDYDNLLYACPWCNRAKWDIWPSNDPKINVVGKEGFWHQGYRYRKNDKRLPGSPDIAILKYHIAVFVDGEFWHGKDWETRKKRLKRNREYWIEKIEENMARDLRDDQLLMQTGWVPIHFWEKEVIKDLSTCVATIEEVILAQMIESADAQGPIDYEE